MSACAVPATSQVRNRSVSGWRAAREPIETTSVSVWKTRTGTVEVVADPHDGSGVVDRRLGRLGERRRVAAAAVHEEAVVDARRGLDRVEVGDEAERRLRLAGAEHAPRAEPAEEHVRALAHRAPRLREQSYE